MQQEVDRIEDKRTNAGNEKKSRFEKLKNIKHLDILIALIILVFALTLYFGVFKVDKNEIVSNDNINDALLHDLERVLSSIDGVGKTKIIINYDNNDSLEIAERVETVVKVDNDGVSHIVEETREPIIIRGSEGDNPIVLNSSKGRIQGVIVVASGGDNVKVKLALMDAISTLLEVDRDNIKVYGMKKY